MSASAPVGFLKEKLVNGLAEALGAAPEAIRVPDIDKEKKPGNEVTYTPLEAGIE